jgi:hypothetical protein
LHPASFSILLVGLIAGPAAAPTSALAPAVNTIGSTGATPGHEISPAANTAATLLTPPACNGSLLDLTPGTPAPNFTNASEDIQRGVIVSVRKDFQVCSMGIKMQVSGLPQTLWGYVYEVNYVTRGALVASGSVSMTGLSNVMHFVPINCTLKACQEYELVFTVAALNYWEWWDENFIAEPFDVGGVIRVRHGSSSQPIHTAVPHIQVIGTPVSSPTHSTDFAGPNVANSAGDDDDNRGIYVRMLDTARLCSFGFEADLVAGQVLTATVYSATGTTRGAAIATGTYTVPSSGLQWHDVPIDAQLVEGRNYDMAIQFGTANSWPWWDENTFPEPFSRDVFELVTAEFNGGGGNTALPHYRATWQDKTGGVAFNLSKPDDSFPPPNSTNQPGGAYGMYITSLAREEVYGVGWMADVAPGQTITATVYQAIGNARGAITWASGSIVSGAAGMRWHDIPLSATLFAGTDYDINISFSNATEWRYWSDLTGAMPYTSYGVIQVRNSEYNGDPSNFALIEMRVHVCNQTLTPVRDAPARVPMFLAAPAPNPIAGQSRLDFSLDEGGPVAIRVYDVMGRLVNTVLEGTRSKGWSTVRLDSKSLASGVYFLKLETRTGSVTRKFVVAH